ncbi:flagellar basal body rod protein FlgC [Massilia luteola]|uniref:flagellar basal body rod protein FlgC n=1 Tax=Massilia luteola TaxID=3081751 RepID=UPI002ACBEDF2|nr:flagellar basal body rod protein FlgC [Massilia sp. Gc5]
MDYLSAFQISASGMAVEKMRLDLTTANIAAMHTAAPNAASVYRPMHVVAQAVPLSFAQRFGEMSVSGGGARIVAVQGDASPPRQVYEPGHPYADAKGFVNYPAVDQVAEMLNVNTALRAYEANVAAMSAARTMAARALDIGGAQ